VLEPKHFLINKRGAAKYTKQKRHSLPSIALKMNIVYSHKI